MPIKYHRLVSGDFWVFDESLNIGEKYRIVLRNWKTGATWAPLDRLSAQIDSRFSDPYIHIPREHGERIGIEEDEINITLEYFIK